MTKEELEDELFPHEMADQDDEIEILEVVGIDEDAPPTSDGDDLLEVDADEVVLSFDEDGGAGIEESQQAAGVPADLESANERLSRLRADFENYRKRVDKERDEYRRQAVSSVAQRLLPVLDNFERAIQSAPTDGDQGFTDGVRLIYRQMMDELRHEGLEAIDSVGTPFDPSRHEAVSTDTSGENPPNVVLEEYQRGYMFQGKLLRPSRVRVTIDPAVAESNGLVSEGS